MRLSSDEAQNNQLLVIASPVAYNIDSWTDKERPIEFTEVRLEKAD